MANQKQLNYPSVDGWYWVLVDGYKRPIPCWYMKTSHPDPKGDPGCFLPGGMGDSSSTGLYSNDISKIGPEIIEPFMG
jgi:hypothetical protein